MAADPEVVKKVGSVLNDRDRTLAERFRALFTLRGTGGQDAIDQISRCLLNDDSSLLKHECGYCLGQMGDSRAVPVLRRVLEDASQETIVRHEAGEALGAIGDASVLPLLQSYRNSSCRELAETCDLAVCRIAWLGQKDAQFVDNNPYTSVDPAPPSCHGDVSRWREELVDLSLGLFERYRAMFALRNSGGPDSVSALVAGFQDPSALFKHEVAYVLGQMQHPAAVEGLEERLRDLSEDPMVRHECAEALGSIATPECLRVLEEFLEDGERIVRESCQVALDMYQYRHSQQFQYADTAIKLMD